MDPRGSSTRPVFLTFPTKEKTLVPLLFAVPKVEKKSPPRAIMRGILHQVSTLLIVVGLPYKPCWAGKGGRGEGLPAFPSMDAIRAVSSPQTKAPAPVTISISKLDLLPSMSCPGARRFWPVREPW